MGVTKIPQIFLKNLSPTLLSKEGAKGIWVFRDAQMCKLVINILFVSLIFLNCEHKKPFFELVNSSKSNIDFNNKITENETLNPLKFEYIYNGAGVAVADFNNDGLMDVYFTGNQVSSELYLNKGDFEFENVTQASGTGTKVWCTGVAIVDINQDGWQDIYLSTINPNIADSTPKLLFINQKADKNGTPIFKEMAAEVGLADSSYATQASFFDFDLDGDLDMYLLTNALELFSRNNLYNFQKDGKAKSVDKLFRNEGIGANGLPTYKNIGIEAGILEHGWGLGLVIKDINQDGWPDIYVANDFQSNDLLYINQKNGTFKNEIAEILAHQSHNSMGVDIADINNDGFEEISVMDMMPDDNLRQKMMFGSINYDSYEQAERAGFQPQFVRNMLQYNYGMNSKSKPVFGDIGYLAGVNATDWSWSTLFADFDNDGFRDLFITNGYPKDVTNLDFVSYRSSASIFGIDSSKRNAEQKAMDELEGVYKSNFMFRNNGNLTFSDKAKEWGLSRLSYTNGAAYADFDNDGDLDLIMNNINDKAFVYRNLANNSKENKTHNNYIRIDLLGRKGNLLGIGTKLKIYANGQIFYDDHTITRGYKSTMEPTIHIGLGKIDKIDSLEVIWLSGNRQLLNNVGINKTILLKEIDSKPYIKNEKALDTIFEEITADSLTTFLQIERQFVDYKFQPTIPHKLSQLGPGMAVADVNNDGLDDLYVSGSLRENSYLFIQTKLGKFIKKPFPKVHEELGVLFFDADTDGDADLYVVAGGREFQLNHDQYQDVLYINNGKGEFDKAPSETLPNTKASGSIVTANDFDADGDLDLFVAGRQVPGLYPVSPKSYLLRNDTQQNKVKFTDVTKKIAPNLSEIGMVTSSIWTDTDNDGYRDLILVGEWMPITLFKNIKGKSFVKQNIPQFVNTTSLWNSISGGDFDNDGDIDYFLGNLGGNSRYKASENEPVTMYGKDFDNNGNIDPILTHYIQGKEYLSHPRNTLNDQIVSTKKLTTSYEIYGKLIFDDIFKTIDIETAFKAKATSFKSILIENQGGNNFTINELPIELQTAPIFGTQPFDVDQDGNLDILAVGNDYSTEPLAGRYDASIGWYLKGDGKGNFKNIKMNLSGLCIKGDSKSLVILNGKNNTPLLFVGKNFGQLQSFKLKNYKHSKSLTIRNSKQKIEKYLGNGYLSQTSNSF